MLEIVDDRDDRGPLLITSQLACGRRHDVAGDMSPGDRIVDRIVHRAHRLELAGASLRKRRSMPSGLNDSVG
ncbi:MAG: ATP-binding protein [Janthinobacterium lividum]